MPPREEARHGRAGHRKSRHHFSPERVNTARADEKYCSIALQHVNAMEELPASEAEFSFTDSPNFRRLQHKVYELSEGPETDQSQIPLFQRPTSSGSLSKGECFAFETRQHREVNVKGGKQPPIQRASLLLQSNQRGHSADNAAEHADGISLNEKQGQFLLEPSKSVTMDSKDLANESRVDLTPKSTSATMPSIQPMKMTEDRQSIQDSICQGPSGHETNESRSDHSVQSGADESSLRHIEKRDVEIQSCSPLNVMPSQLGGTEQVQKHGQNVQHSLPLTNVPQLRSEPTLPPTVPPQQNLLPPTTEQMLIFKKETQDSSAQQSGLNVSRMVPKEAHNDLLGKLEQSAVTQAALKNLAGTELTGSECEHNVDGLLQETPRFQLRHTPPANARRPIEKVPRVCKVVPPPRLLLPHAAAGSQRVSEQPKVRATLDGPVASSGNTTPSEEDLFYLLMYRQRQRKNVETGILARQKQLETANARLTQQNQNYQRQLSSSRTNQDQAIAEAKLQKMAMEEFKIRFQKLKTFVNGLSNDYSTLREQADQMRISRQDLLRDKEDICKNLQSCQTVSATSERSMSSIMSEVAKVRQSIAPLQRSLLHAMGTLEGESRLLSKERQKNKRLETYLLRVATTQNRYSSAIQDEQKEILTQLKHITTKVNAVEKATTAEPEPLQLPGLDKCVSMLTTIHDADRVAPADLTKLTDAVSTLSQSFSSHQRISDESFQAAADARIDLGNQLVAQITDLLKSLHAASVEEGQLAGLREDRIRLKEQLKSSENMMCEVREGRASASARESQLRTIMNGILDELKGFRNRQITLPKPSLRVDERDMIGTWQMKYTAISQQLTGSEERVVLREKELRQGEEEVQKMSEKLQEAHAERDIAVQALKEAEDRNSIKEGKISELQQKLAEKESSLEILRVKAQSAEARIGEETKKTEELDGLRIQLQAELEEANSTARSATHERAKADQQVQELDQTLKGRAEAEQEAKRATDLMEELQNEHTKVIKLHLEIAPLEEMARQIPGLKQEISRKQKTIESLESRLKGAEAVSKRVEAMEREASKSLEEISTLQETLTSAYKNATWVVEQKAEFQKTTQEVEELRLKLVELQALANRVPCLQEEAKNHSDEVVRLKQDLTDAKESVEQLQELQAKHRRNSEEIVLLKKELRVAEEQLKRLQNVKERSEKKDHDARNLHERPRATEDNLIRLQGLNETLNDRENLVVTLNQELDAAKHTLKHLQCVQNGNARKDEETASLKARLGAAESNLNEVRVAKEESQRKEIELSALKDRLAKIEEISQRVSQTRPEQAIQDQVLAQGTLALSQDVIPGDDDDFQAGMAVTEPPAPSAIPQRRRKAGCNVKFVNPKVLQTGISETVRVQSKCNGNSSLGQGSITPTASHQVQITQPDIFRTQETTFVPESRPAPASQYEQSFGSVSSPLTEVDFLESSCEPENVSAYFGAEKAANGSSATFTKTTDNSKSNSQRGPPSIRTRSSSYGETMLLEAEEDLKDLEQHHRNALQESSTQLSGVQSESSSTEGPPARKTKGSVSNGGDKSSSKTRKWKSKGDTGASSRRPSPRRLRSGSQTQPNKALALQERSLSDQNIAASPQRGVLQEKHLPNSAAKRRLDDDDDDDDEMSITSPSQGGSKRLRRSVSALETKTPTNRKGPFLDQTTSATGPGRLNHPSMPTGGRKGSIIGTSAPAPSAGHHAGQKLKKSSKNERYSARFNTHAA